MPIRTLFNILKLAYTPISSYEFSIVKDDDLIKSYINTGKLYIIAQRPVLTFENLNLDRSNELDPYFTFEIHQRGGTNHLKGRVQLYQPKFGNDTHRGLQIGVTYAYPKPVDTSDSFPFNSVANFVLRSETDTYIWLSPEKLLYHHLRDTIDAEITGNIETFLRYNVHYIGKATKQDLVKRLTGHSHLQDILSLETPFHYGSLPTDEIALLFFDFEDNLLMKTFGEDDPLDEAVDMVMGKYEVEEETIYLDAEKALINALKPKHNRQLYTNYPNSVDGLAKHDLALYSYSIKDPITLVYTDGEIRGGADKLIIKKGLPLRIQKGDE